MTSTTIDPPTTQTPPGRLPKGWFTTRPKTKPKPPDNKQSLSPDALTYTPNSPEVKAKAASKLGRLLTAPIHSRDGVRYLGTIADMLDLTEAAA